MNTQTKFTVGDIVEVIEPTLLDAYSGLYKVKFVVKGETLSGEDWIAITDVTNTNEPKILGEIGVGIYYIHSDCLRVLPEAELAFKLIKYLDK